MSAALEFDLLIAEEKQMHDYLRQVSQLSLAWFTFFGTANLAALAWSASSLATPTPGSKYVIYLLSSYFVIQSALGLSGILHLRKHFIDCQLRLTEILKSHGSESERVRLQTTPVLYAKITVQLLLGLASFIALWLVLAVLTLLSK